MKNFNKITMLFVSFLLLTVSCNAKVEASNSDNTPTAKSIYDFTMNDIDGKATPLSKYKGKVVVIVNTASECGLVAQLGEIEAFSKKYADKGVVVLGFPANNFLGQEPLENKDIKTFCSKNYGVTFQLFEKISVKGGNIAPLYKYLTDKEENGVIDAPVKWNYQKFIIGKDGKVVSSISPRTSVNDTEFLQSIDDLLK
ncbi:MAG: glutathione peroxidase [Saprospirales bacterium]|nr:glutathione peroxidase [Saprospirales bacterium]